MSKTHILVSLQCLTNYLTILDIKNILIINSQ